MIHLIPPTVEKYGSSGWGASRAYRGGYHAGIDFPSKRGSPVIAAADGEVVQVNNSDSGNAGRYISIHHGGGIHTRYLHNTTNLVAKGQRVRQGEQIATVGTTGTASSGPHVHFDVKMSKAGLEEYRRRYGEPTTGLFGTVSVGTGVPAETFMDGAKYSQKLIDSGLKKGVVFFQPSPFNWLMVGAAVFVAWGAWRLLK
jgi:murein DD-endopeptidase MepM/ murein hydrolase activator NlpD